MLLRLLVILIIVLNCFMFYDNIIIYTKYWKHVWHAEKTDFYFSLIQNHLIFVFFLPFLRYWHRKRGWKINTRPQHKLLKSGNVWKSYYLNLHTVFGI